MARPAVLPDDLVAYLRRLDVDPEPPTAEALRRLHRAHVERIPYETTWIHMDHRWGVDRGESVRRIAFDRRGGYCFHLNGAFSVLLDALGYDVSLHVGGVHGPDGPAETHMDNHLVLVVSDLESDDNASGCWYVDAGLGDALHEPLPLLAGRYEQGPFTYGLERTSSAVGDWHFEHAPGGSFPGMAFRSAPVEIDAFVARNQYLSTSPESNFATIVSVQRRDADGIDMLRGLVMRRLHGDGTTEHTLSQRDDWFDVLRDTFDLPLDDVSSDDRDRLWARTRAAHDAWERRQALDSGRSGPAPSDGTADDAA